MRAIKDFDCVQMKWDIQKKHLEEERLLGREEAHRRQDERLSVCFVNSPIGSAVDVDRT
jgi:hypothetical protein